MVGLLIFALIGMMCGYIGDKVVVYLHNFSSDTKKKVDWLIGKDTVYICVFNLLLFMLLGYANKGILTCVFCYVLFLNAVSDYKYRETSTLLNYLYCVLYLIMLFVSVDFSIQGIWGTEWGHSLLGVGILLILGLLSGSKYFGAGDYDVLAVILLTLGYLKLFFVIFIASVVGILFYVLSLRKSEDKTIPFASCLFVGALVIVLYLSFL